MRKFHLSIAVTDYSASVSEYSNRLGCQPAVEVSGRYALWRTDLLNFSISCKSGQPGGVVRHVGFEDESETVFREEIDCNGIVWEYFSEKAQRDEIEEKFLKTP